jgi:integral membrane sensor domain MASE1
MNNPPPQVDKWHPLLAIVGEQPELLQKKLSRQFKHLLFKRIAAENILVFLLQYSGLMLSTYTPHPFPLWLAAGTACAFTFMRGYSVLPGIAFGSLFACYSAHLGLAPALYSAIIFTLQAQLMLYVCHRYISPSLIFSNRTAFIKFILFSSLLTALASFTLLAVTYSLHSATNTAILKLWSHWWLANLNGIFICSFSLVTLDTYFPEAQRLKQLNQSPFFFLYSLLLAFFIALLTIKSIYLSLPILALLTFSGSRYGWCGAIVGVCLLGFIACLAASVDMPALMHYSSLIFLQAMLSAGTVVSLLAAIRKI